MRRLASSTRAPAPARRRLRSMRVSDSCRDFVLDQLADLLGLRHGAMFGGIGLYAGVTFFGILAGVAATARTPRTKLKTSRGRRT